MKVFVVVCVLLAASGSLGRKISKRQSFDGGKWLVLMIHSCIYIIIVDSS